MMTRRQKNSIRGFTAVLSSCALLSGFLIYTNIMNNNTAEPVVLSDILEGAVAYADSDDRDAPAAVTLRQDELMETMFSEQLETFTLAAQPSYTFEYTGVTLSYPDTLTGVPTELIADAPDITADSGSSASSLENLNEITLLSDELDGLRTTTSASQTTSVSAGSSASATTTSASGSTSVNAPGATYIDPSLPVTTSRTTTAASTAPRTTATTTSRTTAATTAPTTTTSATTASTTTTAATTVTTTSRTTATAASTGSGTSKTPFTNVGGGTFSDDDNIYLTLFRLVNDARKEAGVGELWYSARVHDVCELRCTELTSYYSHTRPDGSRFSTAFTDIGIKFRKCGENIAYGRNMFDTPEEVFEAWMNSESHRENILSPDYECCAFGLSILKVGKDTYYYWAQEFAKF